MKGVVQKTFENKGDCFLSTEALCPLCLKTQKFYVLYVLRHRSTPEQVIKLTDIC